MKELEWDESLQVGVEEIDDDHRRMVGLFNLLARSINDQEAPAYVEAVLDELIAFTAWHFRHEERLMLKYSYADKEHHSQLHRDLVDGVMEIREKFLENNHQMEDEDIEYLERWVTAHIVKSDKKMAAYLTSVM